VLPYTGVLVVGVISFREMEQVPSLLSGGGFDRFDSDCYSIQFCSPFFALAHAPPFIVSKGRAQVTFTIKW
jgi:hypothetical protein